jgi:hypothetical protein
MVVDVVVMLQMEVVVKVMVPFRPIRRTWRCSL